jgi:hypothetical protein
MPQTSRYDLLGLQKPKLSPPSACRMNGSALQTLEPNGRPKIQTRTLFSDLAGNLLNSTFVFMARKHKPKPRNPQKDERKTHNKS